MRGLKFRTVFSKLFTSVMLTLVIFAMSMIMLTHVVHDNSAQTRWEILAQQIFDQIDPFVDELDNAITADKRLQARFMLAVIKKSFDIFDESLHANLGLYDKHGHLLIQTDSTTFPKTLPDDPSLLTKLLPFVSSPPTNVQIVGDRGYILLYEPRNPPQRSELWAMLNLFTGTLLLIAFMGIVLWWIAHSITARIDQMNQQMSQLGEGDFSVRVSDKGNDEIASLARGFNQTAQKIEQLINANNLLLAHASHEIRTPITRIRLQIEMMQMLTTGLPDPIKEKFDKRAHAVNRDLTGLNDLVESILLVSRLDAGHAAENNEIVDLYELVSLECQHYPEAHFYGQSLLINGQPKLLIHLIRNLLNNAMIHGVPPIQVQLYGVMHEFDAYTPPADLLLTLSDSKKSDKPSLIPQDSQTPLTAIGDNKDIDEGVIVNNNKAVNSPKAINTEQGVNDKKAINGSAIDSSDTGLSRTKATDRVAQNTTYIKTSFIVNAPYLDCLIMNDAVATTDHNNKVSNRTTATHAAFTNAVRTATLKYVGAPALLKSGWQKMSDKKQSITDEGNIAKQGTPNTPLTTTSSLSTKAADEDKSATKRKTDNSHKSNEGLFPKLRRAKPTKPMAVPRFAVLAVIDQGLGIPEDKREDIFSPFVRLQQKKKGSGLGLSLVAQIVEAHHGVLRTDTYKGHTRFIVILPTHNAAATSDNKN